MTPGTALELGGQPGRIVDHPAVVGQHAGVRSARRIPQHRELQPTQRRGQAEGEKLEGNRGMEL